MPEGVGPGWEVSWRAASSAKKVRYLALASSLSLGIFWTMKLSPLSCLAAAAFVLSLGCSDDEPSTSNETGSESETGDGDGDPAGDGDGDTSGDGDGDTSGDGDGDGDTSGDGDGDGDGDTSGDGDGDPLECGELLECGGECVDPLSDLLNCGDCGVECDGGPNAEVLCNGECVLECDEGFDNCSDEEPGCEADLTDIASCGACGHVCEMGDECLAPDCLGLLELVSNGDFANGMADWSVDFNPMNSLDDANTVFEVVNGVMRNQESEGPSGRAAYQDLEVPPGITGANLSFNFTIGLMGGGDLDPENVDVIEPDPLDQNMDGFENAYRIDFIDPEEDLFYAPILFSTYTPITDVGVYPDQLAPVLVDSPQLLTFLQEQEGNTLRLRIAQVESTFPYSWVLDDVSLQVEALY